MHIQVIFNSVNALMQIVDTYKRSISNVQPGRVATSYNAQKDMHWNKINNKGVASPRANLKEFNNMQSSMNMIRHRCKYKRTLIHGTYHVKVCYGI